MANELNKSKEYFGKNEPSGRKPIAKLLGAGHKDFSGYSEHYNQQYGFSYLLFPEPAENQIYSISGSAGKVFHKWLEKNKTKISILFKFRIYFEMADYTDAITNKTGKYLMITEIDIMSEP